MYLSKLKILILIAILIAMTMVLTSLVQIPLPNGSGYFNLGDGIIIASGLILGPIPAFIIGGLASSLIDLMTAYAFYAPFTFVAKGLEGAIVGLMYKKTHKKYWSALLGAFTMALSYWIADLILFNLGIALTSLPLNLIQGLTGATLALFLYNSLHKHFPQI